MTQLTSSWLNSPVGIRRPNPNLLLIMVIAPDAVWDIVFLAQAKPVLGIMLII